MSTVKWEEWVQIWHNAGEPDSGIFHDFARKFENKKAAEAFAEVQEHNVYARNVRVE